MQTVQATTYWEAVTQRNHSLDGQFVYAVLSTGVFCRPGCPSRTPRRENVRFFSTCQDAVDAGFRPCLRCRPQQKSNQDIEAVCAYIGQHLDQPLPLSKLSEISGLSSFHLQRKFKSTLGISPRQYADQLRLTQVKDSVRNGASVTDALYEAGFGSSSRLYERTPSHLGMTPKAYQKGAASQIIQYATGSTPFGELLIAATDRGVCAIQFGDSRDALLPLLEAEFPAATLMPNPALLAPYLAQLIEWMEGKRVAVDLPLDVRATTFQRLVWEYLQTIPYGATRSYSEIAHDLGSPTATRAVARACATNPIAVAIPCHRVVKQDGALAGYRWGIDRKKAILALESQHAEAIRAT